MKLSAETLHFIEEHLSDDVCNLALQAGKRTSVDMPAALTQIAGYQIASNKLPTWSRTKGILYPRHLSLEQCSSEATARYKARLVSGNTFADLTGGFGIDCYFLSTRFKTSVYVEQQEELCDIARHNFTLLNRPEITVLHADGTEYLQQTPPVDCLFLDPARRDAQGGKTVAIADCEPNIQVLEKLLLEKASTVLIKLSPMLDISQALKDLHSIQAIHVVSVDNECKELLLVLSATSPKEKEEVELHCVNLTPRTPSDKAVTVAPNTCSNQTSLDKKQLKTSHFIEDFQTPFPDERTFQQSVSSFMFTWGEETQTECRYTHSAEEYLYEPNASVMKAGGYRSIAKRYGLKKLHPNSHLYTSSQCVEDFPGRRFVIDKVYGFSKKELKSVSLLKQANLTIRNFPASVNELRKRLRLNEGGRIYLFATTFADGHKALLQCRKV